MNLVDIKYTRHAYQPSSHGELLTNDIQELRLATFKKHGFVLGIEDNQGVTNLPLLNQQLRDMVWDARNAHIHQLVANHIFKEFFRDLPLAIQREYHVDTQMVQEFARQKVSTLALQGGQIPFADIQSWIYYYCL